LQYLPRKMFAIDAEALALIARAAEGSVRDALSLLDQAIAYGAGAAIGIDSVRMMLGVADRTRVIDLFEEVMKGDIAAALVNLKDQIHQGRTLATCSSSLPNSCISSRA